MSAAARAMSAGLKLSAPKVSPAALAQLTITNKTKASAIVGGLSETSSRVFYKQRLTRNGALAEAAQSFVPFTWSSSTFKLARPASSAGRSFTKGPTGRRQPAVDVNGGFLFA